MQPLGEQGVHHKIRWMQGLAHQRCPVDRIEFHVANASLSESIVSWFYSPPMLKYRRKGHWEIYK